MEQVKHTLKVHSTMLTSIMREANKDMQLTMELPRDIRFPLKSVTEVEELEAKLKDLSTKKLVVSVHVDIISVGIVNISLCFFALAVP